MHETTNPTGENDSRPVPNPVEKIRLRFRKDGDLRLVSHHDLMHCFERMLRRAEIPFRYTQGYHPKPRLVFALSLALGLIGCEEVAELELQAHCEPEDIAQRLAQHTPPGLTILRVDSISLRTKAQVNRVCYHLPLPSQRITQLAEPVRTFLLSSESWIERTRPKIRQINVRPYVRNIQILPEGLEIDLWVSPYGMARPEEILSQIGLQDVWDRGVILSRTKVELQDETKDLASRPAFLDQKREPGKGPSQARSQPQALIPGPFSFDS